MFAGLAPRQRCVGDKETRWWPILTRALRALFAARAGGRGPCARGVLATGCAQRSRSRRARGFGDWLRAAQPVAARADARGCTFGWL